MAELFDTHGNEGAARKDGANLLGSGADKQSTKQMSEATREALVQQFLLTGAGFQTGGTDKLVSSRTPESNNSLVGDFLYSAAYAGLQTPASGVGQLVDKVAGTHIQDKVQFMSAPTEAKFGSANWHAQQLGGAVGMIAPFMVTAAGTKWGLARAGLAAEGSGLLGAAQLAKNAKSLAILEGAASGFAFDFATRPVQDGEGNFWAARLKHGVTGAATFGTLTASSIGLRSLGGSAAAELTGAKKVLTDIGIGTASGLPAGLVAAQSGSLLTHGKLASLEETGKSMYTMGFVGGFLSYMHQIPGQRKSFAETVIEQATARDRATNLQNLLAARSLKAESGATVSDAMSGITTVGRDGSTTPKSSRSILDRLLPKATEGTSRLSLTDALGRKFASDAEGKSDFFIEVPAGKEAVLTEKAQAAYKVAGVDGTGVKATPQEVAEFFKWAESAEGIELRTAMGQIADAIGMQKLNTIMLEAYLPRNEAVTHRVVSDNAELQAEHKVKLKVEHEPTQDQIAKWKEFLELNHEPPRDAQGYAQFRENVFKWLDETGADPNLKTLHDWARQFNDQNMNAISAGPLDYYFGTNNMMRFVEVYNGVRPAVEVIEPQAQNVIVDETAAARVAADQASAETVAKTGYVKAPFDVQARLNSFETSTGKAKVMDAVLLAEHTHLMSEAQFNKWIEYVTNPPAGTEATMLRSMITKSEVLKRPEVQKAITNGNGTTTAEATDITLNQVREFLAAPKPGEVKPMPEWMKDYIEMRVQMATMTAKPEAQAHQILDGALPRWLSENIKGKYVKPAEAQGQPPIYSEMLPPELVQLFEAARQSRPPGKPERTFTPDKNDFAYRSDKLEQVLKVDDPVIRESLMKLAPQDHSVLRAVLQKLDPEKSAAENKELLQIVLPKTENLQDVKMLFDVMFFGNRANQNSRPKKPMPGKPEASPEQLERAVEETKAHQQLAALLLESMVPSTDAKFARASEIVDGIITGKYRDPRPPMDGKPGFGGKPGGGFGDRGGGDRGGSRFSGSRDVDTRRSDNGGGEKKNAGTERVQRQRRVLDDGTNSQTTRNDRGSDDQHGVSKGVVEGTESVDLTVGRKDGVDKDAVVVGTGGVEKGVAVEPTTVATGDGDGVKVVEQGAEQRRGPGDATVVTGTERVVTDPVVAESDRVVTDRVDERGVVEVVTEADTNSGGNGQVVVEPPVEFREPHRKGGRRGREEFEEEGDYGYGERDRRDNHRKKNHRGHHRNRGGGKDWRNMRDNDWSDE